ncbi:MAG: FmdB family zinc ribbon protein [Promethearchaeota archaeon]
MRIADYRCESCESEQEVFISDIEMFPPIAECEVCGGECRRIFSRIAVICHQGKCGNSKNGYTSNSVEIKKS